MSAEILTWGFIATFYIAAFSVLRLEKQWHRTAEVFFSLATFLALVRLVLWIWNTPDGLLGGFAFILAIVGIVANMWFVRKVEGLIQTEAQIEPPQGLVVSYNGGRYDHKVSKEGKIVYRIIRLQLENKSDKTINGIRVKAESFDSLGTVIPQVPLRICHDEHNDKKDGFPLTPGEKEMVDVVEKEIGWDVTRLCHPLSPDIVTRETDFKVTIVITADGQPKQQKRLRIAVDDADVLRCDPVKT